jgi:hypothetical protein
VFTRLLLIGTFTPIFLLGHQLDDLEETLNFFEFDYVGAQIQKNVHDTSNREEAPNLYDQMQIEKEWKKQNVQRRARVRKRRS